MKRIVLALLLVLGLTSAAQAACTLPFTIQTGSTPSQVNSNFTTLATTCFSTATLANATSLSGWTPQIHQNGQTGECYGTGANRVLCASDQNVDLIADHSTIQTQDASMITTVTLGGSTTTNDIVGLNWQVASTTYNIRYTVQAGDTLTTIATNLAKCINGTTPVPAGCVLPAGFLPGLLAFQDANSFGYKPTANSNGAVLTFDQPWAASGNSVATSLSGGATETMTITNGNILDIGPYIATTRWVPGRTPVVGDQIGMLLYQGQSSASSGINTQYGALVAQVLAQDATNPQGEILFETSDSLTGKNLGTKMSVGNGIIFYDAADTKAGCGYQGLGVVVVCGRIEFDSATLPQWSIVPQAGANDGQAVIDTGNTGTNAYLRFRYRAATKMQIGEFGSDNFGIQDASGGAGNNGYALQYTPSTALTKLGNGGIITLTFGGGVQVGAPTGGDKGAGALNIQGTIWTNGTQGVASKTCTVNQALTLIITNGLVTGGTCNS